ncbi:hypothetical protein HWV00_04490 [Moritella sp. 24]|uniref:hypothetical protein n=1 Tax=Moritella sp. 24 TaxID=2746230 RepID=UPI001BA97E60|nr:hypothetical protein [Moritella sp. 24]QUM75550.1 hypothetical protein HWV00_04490 [Moritella sp. 24]
MKIVRRIFNDYIDNGKCEKLFDERTAEFFSLIYFAHVDSDEDLSEAFSFKLSDSESKAAIDIILKNACNKLSVPELTSNDPLFYCSLCHCYDSATVRHATNVPTISDIKALGGFNAFFKLFQTGKWKPKYD